MNLRTLYEKLTGDQRRELASKAGINPEYLYQLATKRRVPSLAMLVKLAQADRRLKVAHMADEFAEGVSP